MDNSYFLYSNDKLSIERLHICTWEFKNNSSLVELGVEILNLNLPDTIELNLIIPWVNKNCKAEDFYNQLKDSSNTRFIFNDSITGTDFIDGEGDNFGVVQKFTGREDLCIAPMTNIHTGDSKIVLKIDIRQIKGFCVNKGVSPNLYFRFSIQPDKPFISMRKKGIGKAIIIYDIKVNERRNIPEPFVIEVKNNNLCHIKKCFCFNIVPNNYDITFYDSSSLINVRTLEFSSFSKYILDKRLQEDELMVIFSKKGDSESFSFFTIYSKELIGTGQIAAAILINMICSFLLWLPAYETESNTKIYYGIFTAILLMVSTIIYFIKPMIKITRK